VDWPLTGDRTAGGPPAFPAPVCSLANSGKAIKALGGGGNASYKGLPDLLLNCDEQCQLAFLEGYFLGDGTKDPSGRVLTFATSSRDLADGLLCLVGQLSVLAGVTKRAAGEFSIRGEMVSSKPSYQIT